MILVVGKTGYIGGFFTKHLQTSGHTDVIAVSSQDCDFLQADQVVALFRSLQKPCTVVFAAAITRAVDDSFHAYNKNVAMVRNLIDGLRLADVQSVIYLSSADVYGSQAPAPITENARLNPGNWHGLAKYCCEWMLLHSREVNCPVTALRIPGIYGCAPGDRSVIGRMVSLIRTERRVVIYGTGQVLRDYVFLNDLCRLMELLFPGQFAGVLNVATGVSHSILEVVQQIGDVLQIDFDVVHQPVDSAREFDLEFDNRALTSNFPAFRFSDLSVGIRSYLEC